MRRDQLGTDEDEAKCGGRYGSKIKMLIEAIRATDATDRVLVFVQVPTSASQSAAHSFEICGYQVCQRLITCPILQFKDLMQTVADALDYADIKALQLKGTSHQKSNGLEAFQRETFEKVFDLCPSVLSSAWRMNAHRTCVC